MVAGLIVDAFSPKVVTVLGETAAAWADALQSRGVEAHRPASAAPPRTDLVLCIDLLEHTPAGTEADVVARLTDAADVVVFATPVPGYWRAGYANFRPPSFWLEQFLARGYVFADVLRPRLEDRPDFTRRTVDLCLYAVCRPRSEEARAALGAIPELRDIMAAATARIDGLFFDAARHRLHRRDTFSGERHPSLRPVPCVHVPIPAIDVDRDSGHRFRVRFSNTRTRLCLGAGLFAGATVEEDGVPLPHAQMLLPDIAARGQGRYWIGPDQIYFSTPDNSDPRTNGHTYSLRVPAHLGRLADG